MPRRNGGVAPEAEVNPAIDAVIGAQGLAAGGAPGNVPEFVPGPAAPGAVVQGAQPNYAIDWGAPAPPPIQRRVGGYARVDDYMPQQRQLVDLHREIGWQQVIDFRLQCIEQARKWMCLPSGIKRKDDTDLINLAKQIEAYVFDSDFLNNNRR